MHPIKKVTLITIISAGFCSSLFASKTLSSANSIATTDLKTSLEELAEVRKNIALVKVPLINDVSELESEVRQKQSKVDRLLRL